MSGSRSAFPVQPLPTLKHPSPVSRRRSGEEKRLVVHLGKASSDDRPWATATAAAAPATAAGSSSDLPKEGKKHLVKRLDGTVEEVVTGLPPNNPAFAPRQAHPGGKIVTNDKLEVRLRFYERKGMVLTPELEAKKAELDAVAKEGDVWERIGKFKPGGGGGSAPGGGKAKAKGKAKTGAAPAAIEAPPKAAPEVTAWIKNRPKGGVKVLGGVEGALGKRAADEQPAEAPAAKK